ncbi:flagellar protein FlgN [Alkalilimnicola ehrlichii]|uniref:Flagellar protein FlgN n=1 Tax=Alkalilimnicola ehrlichii TaxID=351052 RepID=A0A3E0X278_9GAMM|nr:flagellar export chaperone FlgN [Alkalilimnicola ehrlichii]RFA30716.1 flagellar protein FlgN [Alkalilimnicola ehrlichii]RFA38293.1 flagellar protein FlgN [Alkalilimnicola ehrlichii]
MNQTQKLLSVVADDIQADLREYSRIRELMEALYDGLLERDSVRIGTLNGEIAELTEQAKLRAERRSKILIAFRLEADADGMQRLFSAFNEPLKTHVTDNWQQLGDQIAECQRLNNRNGKLLAMHQEILGQLMGTKDPSQLYQEPESY